MNGVHGSVHGGATETAVAAEEMVVEFDTVAQWTASAVEELGHAHAVPAACQGSGTPLALEWLGKRMGLKPGISLLDCGAGMGDRPSSRPFGSVWRRCWSIPCRALAARRGNSSLTALSSPPVRRCRSPVALSQRRERSVSCAWSRTSARCSASSPGSSAREAQLGCSCSSARWTPRPTLRPTPRPGTTFPL